MVGQMHVPLAFELQKISKCSLDIHPQAFARAVQFETNANNTHMLSQPRYVFQMILLHSSRKVALIFSGCLEIIIKKIQEKINCEKLKFQI